ncbi:MAG: transcription termination/antitermination NusG family protein [Desulfobaccales bacterium]
MATLEGRFAQEFEGINRDEAAPWYVIQTHGRTETKVHLALQRKGLEVFFPQVQLHRMIRGRKVLMHLPLFPNYLFVHAHIDSTVFHQIIKVNGVVKLLGNNGPDPAPADQIESIRTIVTGDRYYCPWRYIEKGKKVRVLDGPLSGVVGILVARKEKQRRLVVAVEMFQRSVTVDLDSESVERWD